MWRSTFWRMTFILMSTVMLMTLFVSSVMATYHENPSGDNGGGGGGGNGGGGGEVVTAVPSTGVGTMSDAVQESLLLGLVGVACLVALLAFLTARRQRAEMPI